jgi:hypothetical protein
LSARSFVALSLIAGLCFLCLGLPAAQAQSGSWTVSYQHNGTVTYTGGSMAWGDPNFNGYYNGPNEYSTHFLPGPVTSSGTLTAVFTWSGPGPAPSTLQAIIYGKADCTAGPATLSNGFGDSPAQDNTTSQYASQGYHVETVTGGNYPVSLSATDPSGIASADVVIAAYPITINLTGTTPDSSGNLNILVGQGCGASISGLPGGTGWGTPVYAWSVSGTAFQQWSPTTPAIGTAPANPNASYYVGGYGPSTNPTAKWYWNDPNNASETVSCTVTLTPPAGQGNQFSVTATKTVAVQVPGWYATGTGGRMQVNTGGEGQNGAISLYAGPSGGQAYGMNWLANVMSSTLFTSGTLQLVQTVIPSMSYVTYTGVGVPGVTHPDPENGKFGLDTRAFVGWATQGSYQPPSTPVAYASHDDPSIGLSSGVASAMMQHQFTDTLMFQPPGSDTQLVPLGTFGWSTNGGATVPTTDNWADYAMQNGSDAAGTVSPAASTSFTAGNTFPSWTRINVFPNF